MQTETNQTNTKKVGYPTFDLCTPNPRVIRKILNSFSRLVQVRDLHHISNHWLKLKFSYQHNPYIQYIQIYPCGSG